MSELGYEALVDALGFAVKCERIPLSAAYRLVAHCFVSSLLTPFQEPCQSV